MLRPASLGLVRPPDSTQDVSQVGQAIVSAQLVTNPSIAIAVWTARTTPLHRRSGKLKACTRAFLDLCDVAAFADGNYESIFVTHPVCLSPETERILQASQERTLAMADAMHRGEILSATSYFLHLSRLGRQKRVAAEMIAVIENNQLVEFIFVEKLLPHNIDLSRDLQLPYSFTAVIRPHFSRSPGVYPSSPTSPTTALSCPDTSATSYESQKFIQLKWKEGAKASYPKKVRKCTDLKDWRCNQCHASETTQRRRGPSGPLTLCNRCGLRWMKVLEETTPPK